MIALKNLPPPSDRTPIRRALLSVFDKTGLVALAEGLVRHGVELVSTGGSAQTLRDAGLDVMDVSAVTGAPEILGGRVKTLHPAVHGGILYQRNDPDDVQAVDEHALVPFDLVVVNLYPFAKAVADPAVTDTLAAENIDIGGPAMTRAAAKNFAHVAVLTDPAQYAAVLAELDDHAGTLGLATRRRLAADAFARTADYDAAIAAYFVRDDVVGVGLRPTPTDATPTDATPTDATPTDATPTDATPTDATPTDATPTDATPTDATPTDATPTDATPTDATPTDATPTDATPTDATPTDATPTDATPTDATTDATPTDATPTDASPTTDASPMETPLRYGENPHQSASFVAAPAPVFEVLHGKELSYNNLLDLSAALHLMEEFEAADPAVAILKHTNPCGVAVRDTLAAAYDAAFATDTQSPFGGIVVVNRPLDLDAARKIDAVFTELVIAPGFEDGVLDFLRQKANRRLVQVLAWPSDVHADDVRSVAGGRLVQERDGRLPASDALRRAWGVVTERHPTEAEWADLDVAWRVVKHVKSNAIVYAKGRATVGIGAGQMSRIDSAEIAVSKARKAGLSLEGAVVASDAFFPFADGLEAAASGGIRAAVQPGGSVRDAEVIEAANRLGLAMVFTGRRHFRH